MADPLLQYWSHRIGRDEGARTKRNSTAERESGGAWKKQRIAVGIGGTMIRQIYGCEGIARPAAGERSWRRREKKRKGWKTGLKWAAV